MTSSDESPTGERDLLLCLAQALGHDFQRRDLLKRAVTHPSATGTKPTRKGGRAHYERLEFLGDRVLGLIIADLLFERFPQEAEGALAKRHAALVRGDTLAGVAEQIGLPDVMITAPNEVESGLLHNKAALANACEAVIAALYLDGGLEAARQFVIAYWTPLILADVEPPRDAKTSLQEWAQARGLPLPSYRELERQGPAHDPVFTMEVQVQDFPGEQGAGGSKRQAEQVAAQALLDRLEGQGQ